MIGIDKNIDDLRAKIAAKFVGLTAYGRAYNNLRKVGVIPEIMISGTHKYKDVLLDTGIIGTSFMIVDNDYTISNAVVNTTQVDLYFAVNLTKLYPSVTERATEYLHRDVQEIVRYSRFDMSAITSGREAFSDFAETLVKVGDNMQPYYLCKFRIEIEYNINEC
jgi:hypothetical protein